ncbi:MAG TPA: SDR family oxidoreductase [Chloroflexota bacterium]|nr:SDR family oxidoreductase [Chloroflexota bacterium]
MDRLKGKVAVVTGAGSQAEGIGNGKAASILFAREGAKVLCVDLYPERAQETVAAIQKEGGTASLFQADVAHKAGCQAMAAAAMERYGRIDILQNNVGISSSQTLEEITEEAWDNLMGINVRSMVLAAQAVVPHMAANGGGSIINLSSIAGLRAYPAKSTAYTVSKTAIIGVTMALAGQLGDRHIRVNAIAPGQVYTPLVAGRLSAAGRQRRATSGLIKDEGNSWDIGWAAVYLASDEARWVTGQVFPIDAGITITIPGHDYTQPVAVG